MVHIFFLLFSYGEHMYFALWFLLNGFYILPGNQIAFRFTAGNGVCLERQLRCCVVCVTVRWPHWWKPQRAVCIHWEDTAEAFIRLSVSAWTKPLWSRAHSVVPDASNGTNWSMHIDACSGPAAWRPHPTARMLQTLCRTLQYTCPSYLQIIRVWIINADYQTRKSKFIKSDAFVSQHGSSVSYRQI